MKAMAPVDELGILGQQLTTRWAGRAHEHHACLASTNDRAAAWAKEGGPHGAVVTADQQEAGRGRLGRVWDSPPGQDLYVSLLLRPETSPASLPSLSLVVGAALRTGLAELKVGEISLKWPNDLLLEGKKVGGVLCETRWCAGQAEVIVGFGINVYRREFAPGIALLATSLRRANPERVLPSRPQILATLLAHLERTLELFFAQGFAAVRPAYVPYCATLGQKVRLSDVTSERPFVACDLDDDGALLVEPEGGGSRLRVNAGEVEPWGSVVS